jgi:hypothetical protein
MAVAAGGDAAAAAARTGLGEPDTHMTKRAPTLPADGPAGYALQQVAAAKMRADRIRLATELGIFVVLTLLIPALLDYIYFWPLPARFAAEAGWILLFALVLTVSLRQWRRRANAKAVALALERRRPEMRCEVSTAAEYAARPDERPLQAELITGLKHRADFHLRKIGDPYRRHSNAWLVFASIFAAMFALAMVFSPAGRLAVQRILLPWTLPYYTRIAVQRFPTEIAATSDLRVKANFGGRLPLESRIEWKSADGSWKPAGPMTFTARDTASYKFTDLRENLTFRVAANDAVSAEYHVAVYATPDIASWQLDAVPPAYAGLPAQRSTTGEVAVLRGAELRWRLVPTRPLAQARLHFTKGAPDLDLQAGSDGAWTGGMTLKKDADYRALLVDRAQHGNLHPALNHLIAIPDAPPQVEISSPDEVVVADPGDKIPITIDAEDDIGLSSVDLIYRQAGRPPTDVALWPAGSTGRRMTATPVLDLAPMGLKPYDVVIYHAEARDNNTYDGPGVGRSHVQFIVIRGPKQSGQPMPMPGGGSAGQEINLTEMERDLIGATTGLADNAPRSAMQDLATAQQQIQNMAAQGNAQLQGAHADPAAGTAMAAAVGAMAQAESSLNAGDRPGSIDQEALALAALFQASQFLPGGSSPGSGAPELRIRLENPGGGDAQRQETQKELSQAMKQAGGLAEAEQKLQGEGSGPSPEPDPGSGPGGKPQDSGAGPTDDPSPDGKGAGAALPSQQGSGPSDEPPTPDAQGPGETSPTQPGSGADPATMSAQQQALAEQARQLADFLNQAANKDPAVGHGMGQSAGKAAGEMEFAAGEMKRSKHADIVKVSIAQRSSIEALDEVQEIIKNTLAEDERGTGAEDESVPPEYADQLAHYFQKLSHEK